MDRSIRSRRVARRNGIRILSLSREEFPISEETLDALRRAP
jgi:hypothetical protein